MTPADPSAAEPPQGPLRTVGHGTLNAAALVRLLRNGGIELVVDVRRHPGSRRHPHVAREAMAGWLADAGVAYRWEERLGGRRPTSPSSPNLGLRDASFRGYADYMRTPAFREALAGVLDDAQRQPTAVLCAESLWWRCHRRLIADAAVLLAGCAVLHLGHDGRVHEHVLTPEARRVEDAVLYDAGATPPLPGM